ncbi:MAG TPA: ComF family protein [Rhodocyclaceae bacterium]|nr:ComF family protein [Rhodocyclaceae bacterium]
MPNSCLLCGADGADLLCAGCRADLPPLPSGRCPRCCEPTSGGEHCGRCLAEPPHFDAATALYRYDFPLDRLVHGLKYGGQLSLAQWFGERLAEALAGRHFDSIIPLPLHPSRLRERGFNQSGEIARVVGRRLGLAVDIESCRRWRPNAPQAELPLSRRAANVRGVFECVSDLGGRQVLVIDDVMTSGATLSECARTLKLHGAARVEVAVVARALRN